MLNDNFIITFSLLKDSDSRVDNFLKSLFPLYSREFLKKLIDSKKILVNGKEIKPRSILKQKDIVEIQIPVNKPFQISGNSDLNFEIVYEDDDLLVVNKPAGMSVHPSSSDKDPSLVHGLISKIGNLSDLNGEDRPGIVHRIDKNTTGLLVVAKNNVAHAGLAEQFSAHTIDRIYWGICCDHFKKDRGSLETFLERHPVNRLKYQVSTKGRKAITHYRVLKKFNSKFTLVEFKLQTGRTHQIRVHSNYLKHPIVNDAIYGNKNFEKTHLPIQAKEVFNSSSAHMLHAKTIGFKHPISSKYLNFDSKPSNEMSRVLDILELA